METLVAPFINFAILVGFLAFKLRAPLGEFVRTRHVTIKTELEEVAELLRQAQERFNEYSAKLKAIDAELAAVRDQGKRDAQQTKVRIVQEAERLAKTVVSDAKVGAENFASDLRSSLFTQFGLKIVDRAEVTLRERLTGDDRTRIRQEFSKEVEAIQ